MFKVDVDSLDAYFAFDPTRRPDLTALDRAIRTSAPRLTRYFHAGTPKGEPGMRFKMIGYGPFHSASTSGMAVRWPAIGVALQKNYISVYIPVRKNGAPLIDAYADRLNATRTGIGNFSVETVDQLDAAALADLLAETQLLFETDPNCLPNRID